MLIKYYSGNQTKNDEIGSVCDTFENQERERETGLWDFCWKTWRKQTTGKTRHTWESNTITNFKEIGWEHDCINLPRGTDKWQVFLHFPFCALEFHVYSFFYPITINVKPHDRLVMSETCRSLMFLKILLWT